MPSLSVVLPTINSRSLLPEHVESMRGWIDMADEVIVVDSDSTDETIDYLREHLPADNLRIFSHPRGLYQSWNFGIRQARSKWLYISTVGDTISREHLAHLLETGESFASDVVISKPDFIDQAGRPAEPIRWACDPVIETFAHDQPVMLDGPAAFFFSVLKAPTALVGSSASNIYRTNHLQRYPFPSAFGHGGDAAWSLLYAFDTSFAFTPRRGSKFRFHRKTYDYAGERPQTLFDQLNAASRATLERLPAEHPDAHRAIRDLAVEQLCSVASSYFYARLSFEERHRSRISWYMRPKFWICRHRRRTYGRLLGQLTAAGIATIRRLHCQRSSLLKVA